MTKSHDARGVSMILQRWRLAAWTGVALGAAVLLSAPVNAEAFCTWRDGTPHCDLGQVRLHLGERWNPLTPPTRALPTSSLAAEAPPLALVDDAPAPRRLDVHLQSFSYDPRQCRRIGNETYCR